MSCHLPVSLGFQHVMITDKVTPYKTVTLDEKYQMMREFMLEFVHSIQNKTIESLSNGWRITEADEEYEILFYELVDDNTFEDDSSKIVFTKKNNQKFQVYNIHFSI